MKALVKERPGPGLSLVDVPMSKIAAPDDVLIKVEYCAICVGETKVYDWNEWAANDKTLQLPTVMGHEACGIVAEIGPGVTQFKPGDRVVNDPIIACGFCRQCRAGYVNMCENREILGKRRGAFAEYIVLPERVLCHLPDKITLEAGAVLENFGIAVHAVDVEQHDPGDWAVIIGGGGPIGIMAAQTLRAYGVNTVVTEIAEPRLEFAREHTNGAIVMDAKKADPVALVREYTGGRGADFVIEMAANKIAMDQAFDMIRIRGTIVTIGTFNEPITFNPFFRMTRREIKLQSIMARGWETWRRMEQLIASDLVDLAPLVTHILPMEEFARGFEMVKRYEVQKVLLKP